MRRSCKRDARNRLGIKMRIMRLQMLICLRQDDERRGNKVLCGSKKKARS